MLASLSDKGIQTINYSLRSWRDKRGSAVLFSGCEAARRVGIQVNLKGFSLAASPLTSHGGSAAKNVPRVLEFRQLRRLINCNV